MKERFQEVLDAFGLSGNVVGIEENHGEGHINKTHLVVLEDAEGSKTSYILQQVNTEVFTEPEQVMENVIGVTKYLADQIARDGGDPHRETLTFLETPEGRHHYVDADGGFWRISYYIPDIDTYQQAETAGDFARSGRAFARFMHRLDDYPVNTLYETIPHFHDTPDRYTKFMRALTLDREDRADDVAAEINFVRAREEECGILMDLMREGELPPRVTHNDTKLNNVLFDRSTGDGLCVIDLDTVMPGLVAFDYGDAIRFGASTGKEDEKDLDKVRFSLSYYEAYTRAYLEEVGETLSTREILTLPWGAKLMTYECGMRFLTDYLDGDHYFAIDYPEHNLDRCRTQFKLVAEMEKVWDRMFDVIFDYVDR